MLCIRVCWRQVWHQRRSGCPSIIESVLPPKLQRFVRSRAHPALVSFVAQPRRITRGLARFSPWYGALNWEALEIWLQSFSRRWRYAQEACACSFQTTLPDTDLSSFHSVKGRPFRPIPNVVSPSYKIARLKAHTVDPVCILHERTRAP